MQGHGNAEDLRVGHQWPLNAEDQAAETESRSRTASWEKCLPYQRVRQPDVFARPSRTLANNTRELVRQTEGSRKVDQLGTRVWNNTFPNTQYIFYQFSVLKSTDLFTCFRWIDNTVDVQCWKFSELDIGLSGGDHVGVLGSWPPPHFLPLFTTAMLTAAAACKQPTQSVVQLDVPASCHGCSLAPYNGHLVVYSYHCRLQRWLVSSHPGACQRANSIHHACGRSVTTVVI